MGRSDGGTLAFLKLSRQNHKRSLLAFAHPRSVNPGRNGDYRIDRATYLEVIETMDFFMWSTIVLGIWSALGPLVGILIGHSITKAWQKEQWIAENKKQEYRELLSILSKAFTLLVHYHLNETEQSSEDEARVAEAEADALRTMHDRIFIVKEIQEENVLPRWINAVREFKKTSDSEVFAHCFGEISNEIVTSAVADIKR
jgi:hypothetical protein